VEALTGDQIFEGFDGSAPLVNIVEARDLDQPSDVVRKQLVVDHPFS
jgi:hypothetical protein